MTPRVVLLPRRARPFYGRHPWVFAGAIAAVEGEPADGDVVDLVAHGGEFIARGLYNSRSKIRVRLYTWDAAVAIDSALFRDKLTSAIRLRTALGWDRPGGACRLVFSEGDGLSGLTVDRYDRWLVVQFTALGLARRRELITEILVDLLQPEGIYLRTERGIGKLEGLELQDGLLWGRSPDGPLVIEENGLRFHVNLAEGQKTGFYLDQRDNRQAVARLAAGRRVLDAFCYSGSFGLHAARAGAAGVLGLDQSEPALALARENALLNGLSNVTYSRCDVFDELDALAAHGARFGVVILDPPKFARERRAVEEALRGYRRLQRAALRVLEPEGFLATCCCSGLITMDMLEELLAQLAGEEKRDIQVLERRGPAPIIPFRRRAWSRTTLNALSHGCVDFSRKECVFMNLRHTVCLSAVGILFAVVPVRAGEVDKYLPDDTEMVVSVNVKQIVESSLFKKNVEAKAREALKNQDELQDAFHDLGFDPFTDIDRIIAAKPAGGDPDRGLVIVHGKFDLDKFNAKAQKLAKDQPDLLKVHKVRNGAGGKSLVYEVTIEQAPPVFVALPNRLTLLASPGKDYVADALKKNKAALKNKDMAALLERMNDKQGVSAAVVGSALTGDAPPEVKDLLAKVNAIGGDVTISDEIRIEVAVAAKSADGAKTIKEGLDGGLKEARLTLAALAFANSKQIDALLDVVNSVKASVKGKTVLIKAAVSPDEIENALKKD